MSEEAPKLNRRGFLKEVIGVATAVGATFGSRKLSDILEHRGKKEPEFIKLEINETTEKRVLAYIKNSLSLDILDEDFSNFCLGLQSKNIELEKPIPAYSYSGKEVFIVVKKINGINKLCVEVIQNKKKVDENIFEINQLNTPQEPQDPDWHQNPKPRREKPPTAV